MIILDMQPISIVVDSGFRRHLNRCNPGYTIPTRLTIKGRIKDMYIREKKLN